MGTGALIAILTALLAPEVIGLLARGTERGAKALGYDEKSGIRQWSDALSNIGPWTSFISEQAGWDIPNEGAAGVAADIAPWAGLAASLFGPGLISKGGSLAVKGLASAGSKAAATAGSKAAAATASKTAPLLTKIANLYSTSLWAPFGLELAQMFAPGGESDYDEQSPPSQNWVPPEEPAAYSESSMPGMDWLSLNGGGNTFPLMRGLSSMLLPFLPGGPFLYAATNLPQIGQATLANVAPTLHQLRPALAPFMPGGMAMGVADVLRLAAQAAQ